MSNRIIKESINESRGLSEVSFFANDLYKRLITYADDYGRFNADTAIMIARLYPRELEYISQEDINEALIELVGVEKIVFYTSDLFHSRYPNVGVFGYFPRWKEHQRVRESKNKCPEPVSLSVNDWYLRRFIPIDMKRQIIDRDKFKCRICGKFVTTCRDSKKFVKLGTGTYNIDHIVPVKQGGRATLENLRLTCPECNKSRAMTYSFDEIIDFTLNSELDCDNSPQLAAACSSPPLESNPIQSESNPNTNPILPGAETAPDQQQEKPAVHILLNDGTQHPIFQQQVKEWSALFPGVDVEQELRNMVAWCIANPTRRKTKSGVMRFITSWLTKEQNKSKGAAPRQPLASERNYSHPSNFIEEGEQ